MEETSPAQTHKASLGAMRAVASTLGTRMVKQHRLWLVKLRDNAGKGLPPYRRMN